VCVARSVSACSQATWIHMKSTEWCNRESSKKPTRERGRACSAEFMERRREGNRSMEGLVGYLGRTAGLGFLRGWRRRRTRSTPRHASGGGRGADSALTPKKGEGGLFLLLLGRALALQQSTNPTSGSTLHNKARKKLLAILYSLWSKKGYRWAGITLC
jgi:hypothetical protein